MSLSLSTIITIAQKVLPEDKNYTRPSLGYGQRVDKNLVPHQNRTEDDKQNRPANGYGQRFDETLAKTLTCKYRRTYRHMSKMWRNVTVSSAQVMVRMGFDVDKLPPWNRTQFMELLNANDRPKKLTKPIQEEYSGSETFRTDDLSILTGVSLSPEARFSGSTPPTRQTLPGATKTRRKGTAGHYPRVKFHRKPYEYGCAAETIEARKTNPELPSLWHRCRDEHRPVDQESITENHQATGSISVADKATVAKHTDIPGHDASADGKSLVNCGNTMTKNQRPKKPTAGIIKISRIAGKGKGKNHQKQDELVALAALVGRYPLSLPGHNRGLTLEMNSKMEAATIKAKYNRPMMEQLLKDYKLFTDAMADQKEWPNLRLAGKIVEHRKKLEEENGSFQPPWTVDRLEQYVFNETGAAATLSRKRHHEDNQTDNSPEEVGDWHSSRDSPQKRRKMQSQKKVAFKNDEAPSTNGLDLNCLISLPLQDIPSGHPSPVPTSRNDFVSNTQIQSPFPEYTASYTVPFTPSTSGYSHDTKIMFQGQSEQEQTFQYVENFDWQQYLTDEFRELDQPAGHRQVSQRKDSPADYNLMSWGRSALEHHEGDKTQEVIPIDPALEKLPEVSDIAR